MDEWHRSLLHAAVPALIDKWEPKLKVKVAAYFLQRMKTRWGGCNHKAGNIRLNTELVKKPKDLLEYVIVHEWLICSNPTTVIALRRSWIPTTRHGAMLGPN